ncbi:MAG: hypothetical protein R2818_05895 [Flavobacteriales bacterium]
MASPVVTVLRESGVNGRLIIDNFENFTTGSVSALANTYTTVPSACHWAMWSRDS